MSRRPADIPTGDGKEAALLKALGWFLFTISVVCIVISAHSPLASWVYVNVFAGSPEIR